MIAFVIRLRKSLKSELMSELSLRVNLKLLLTYSVKRGQLIFEIRFFFFFLRKTCNYCEMYADEYWIVVTSHDIFFKSPGDTMRNVLEVEADSCFLC